MQRTTVTIIGAGQAGLAMSKVCSDRSIDHVVLDRAAVANSWRTERWDSLRLLSPNWMTRLPGHRYDGPDPDGYMHRDEVVDFLSGYARRIAAPVQCETRVSAVRPDEHGATVATNQGEIRSDTVVVATGACSTPRIPALAGDLPRRIQQLSPIHYRNPAGVAPGRVLVVGASASGMQIADELSRAGRDVILAVGRHTRVPRTYRGMDIHWWMDAVGLLGQRYDEVDDIAKARRAPSLQLVGSSDQYDLDLNRLSANGVQVVGRLVGVTDRVAQFSGSLANMVTSADLQQRRLLDLMDQHASATGLDRELAAAERPPATDVGTPVNAIDLAGIGAVVWATGFRPRYPWLPDELLGDRGQIIHDGGAMAHPTMFVLGLPFTRRRNSAFIDGVGADAAHLGGLITRRLDNSRPSPAASAHVG